MTVYAKNKDAVAICNRSGQKMMRADMIEDGYLKGLLVHPDWYDPYHPQERPFDPDEGIAIYRPAPDLMPVPPGPGLLVKSHNVVGGNVQITFAITQTNPPGSTVTRWELWRSPYTTIQSQLAFSRVATQLPAAVPIIPVADLVLSEQLTQTPGIINAANMGQQLATITDTTAVNGASYLYYVITDTADTSNTQSPGQFPNGLQSAPTYINALGQTTNAPIVLGNPATTPVTTVALGAVFIATVAPASTKYAYSPDGLAWLVGTFPAAAGSSFNCVAFGGVTNKLWVAVTNSQNVLTSPDGINWTQHATALPATPSAWVSVSWSPKLNLFVAAANAATANPIATSPDGITWTQRTAPATAMAGSCWSARLGLFIVMSNGGTVAPITSADGITWASHTAFGAGVSGGVVYDFGAAFDIVTWASGTNSYGISPDGVTWTQKNTPNWPGGGNSEGAIWLQGSTVFQNINTPNNVRIIGTTVLDLNSGWVTEVAPPATTQTGSATAAVTSPTLGVTAMPAGGTGNNSQIVSTTNGLAFTNSGNLAIGGASALNSIAVAA